MPITVNYIPLETLDNDCNSLIGNDAFVAEDIHLNRLISIEQGQEQLACNPSDIIIIGVTSHVVLRTLDYIRVFRSLSPHTQIIVFCDHSISSAQILLMLGNGVIGYDRFPLQTPEIIANIRRAFKQESIVDKEIAKVLLKEMECISEMHGGLTKYEKRTLIQLSREDALPTSTPQSLSTAAVVQTHVGNILIKYWYYFSQGLNDTAKRVKVYQATLTGQSAAEVSPSPQENISIPLAHALNASHSQVDSQRQKSPLLTITPASSLLSTSPSSYQPHTGEVYASWRNGASYDYEILQDQYNDVGLGILKKVRRLFSSFFIHKRHDRH